MNRTRRLIPSALAATLLAATLPSFAQDNFPNRPIRIVVPFTAGGVVDSVARVIGEKLSTKYGQPVIVENRVGAGGSIGTDFVAKAPADGYTLLCVSPSHAVAPILNKGVTWNPTRDFRGIEGFGIVPNIVVVHPDLPVKDMADLIAMAKRSAQPLTFATAGVGTSNHLAGELLAQVADIKLTPVPYKGQPEALNDMLAGRVTLMPLTSALALGHMRSGKLKGLAVTTAKRSVASGRNTRHDGVRSRHLVRHGGPRQDTRSRRAQAVGGYPRDHRYARRQGQARRPGHGVHTPGAR
jgi:tripartite-type tricarboxylate transporter receptor subunit TctC